MRRRWWVGMQRKTSFSLSLWPDWEFWVSFEDRVRNKKAVILLVIAPRSEMLLASLTVLFGIFFNDIKQFVSFWETYRC